MIRAQLASGDALHPVMFLGPLLGFAYVLKPLYLSLHGDLHAYFPNPTDLLFVQMVNALGVFAFLLGCLRGASRAALGRVRTSHLLWSVARRRMVILGVLCGVAATAAYVYGIINVGGLWRAYSHRK